MSVHATKLSANPVELFTLQSGAVLHRSYQPHEVHIPYLLQFFIDFNLQGMNIMHVSSYKVRAQAGESDLWYVTSAVLKESGIWKCNLGQGWCLN